MSANPSAVSSIGKLENIVTVKGRVRSVSETDNGYYTRLDIPARDEYSGSSVVEVFTEKRLGKEKEVVSVECEIGGYTRRVAGKDSRPDWYACTNTLRGID